MESKAIVYVYSVRSVPSLFLPSQVPSSSVFTGTGGLTGLLLLQETNEIHAAIRKIIIPEVLSKYIPFLFL